MSGSVATAAGSLPPVTPETLDAYIGQVARAWEPDTTPDGEVLDPLDPTDSGDNYGVLLLADVMLKEAARTSDSALAGNGQRIVERAAALPEITGPFNLLAVAQLVRDGRAGRFPPNVWAQIGTPVAQLAARIGPEGGSSCFTTPSCYTNWRLVWSAGASALTVGGISGTFGTPLSVAREIRSDLALATSHAGAPLAPSLLAGARELSDPGSEPPAYHLFSCALLELIAEADPSAMTPSVQRLRYQAGGYALELMAPDGQISYAGRSLDQSWVQAAAADIGARRAILDPAHAGQWRSFADRAFSYLVSAYPPRSDGIVPIVPGLLADWSPTIMDGYAALDQYEGLTLWFLADALDHWPAAAAERAPLPTDASDFLTGDLRSSGLVWGRSGRLWWSVMGRTTANDPRSQQGPTAVKVQTATGWADLLALRPVRSALSAVWTLVLPGGRTAKPSFTSVHGNGQTAVIIGSWRLATGRVVAQARWTVSASSGAVTFTMSAQSKGRVKATVWLPGNKTQLGSPSAVRQWGRCVTSASGPACPLTLAWHDHEPASLNVTVP